MSYLGFGIYLNTPLTSKSTNSQFEEMKFSSSLLVSLKYQVNQVMSLLIAPKFWYFYKTKNNNNFFSSLSLDILGDSSFWGKLEVRGAGRYWAGAAP